jgi:hypothetical protein
VRHDATLPTKQLPVVVGASFQVVRPTSTTPACCNLCTEPLYTLLRTVHKLCLDTEPRLRCSAPPSTTAGIPSLHGTTQHITAPLGTLHCLVSRLHPVPNALYPINTAYRLPLQLTRLAILCSGLASTAGHPLLLKPQQEHQITPPSPTALPDRHPVTALLV